MVDLHSHVLPGIDDGARDLADSIELARTAASDGTRTLAATPHLREDHPGVDVTEIAARCEQLNRDLPPDCRLTVVSGGEADLSWALDASESELVQATYCGRGTDLLVETPFGPLGAGFETALRAVADRGFRILLAHPERSEAFQRDPRRLGALVDQDVLLQVTAGSLASTRRNSPSRRLALSLVEDGLAHVIASDAHSASLPRSWLSAGVEAAAQVAPMRAEWMVTEAPSAILAGQPLPEPPSERPRPRRLAGLRRLARR